MDEIDPGDKKNFLDLYKLPIAIGAGGLFLLALGLRIIMFPNSPKVQFIEESTSSAAVNNLHDIKVEISGAVVKPGVYTLSAESRIQDLLVAAGGMSTAADRVWIAKYMSLAAKLIDGTKIYIPLKGEMSAVNQTQNILGINSSTISKDNININTASKTELDSLSGVGEVTAQKIIDGRPYQAVDELLSRKIVNKSTFEKIKEKINIY